MFWKVFETRFGNVTGNVVRDCGCPAKSETENEMSGYLHTYCYITAPPIHLYLLLLFSYKSLSPSGNTVGPLGNGRDVATTGVCFRFSCFRIF